MPGPRATGLRRASARPGSTAGQKPGRFTSLRGGFPAICHRTFRSRAMPAFTFSHLSRRPLRRTCAGLLGVALLAFGLSAARPAMAEIKVGVSDWPGWVAWYVAEQKGFFKKHGAEVKLVWFANYTDSIAALSSGQ